MPRGIPNESRTKQTINQDHKDFAKRWLVDQLSKEPVICDEKLVQYGEHHRGLQKAATRSAITELLKRGIVTVARTAAGYRFLQLA